MAPTNFETMAQTPLLPVAFELSVVDVPANVQAIALAKAKEAYVMALLEAGEISSGKAASLSEVSRVDIIRRAGELDISLFDDSLGIEELRQEIAQSAEALNQPTG